MVKGIYVPAYDGDALEVRDFTEWRDYDAAVGGLFEAVDVPALGITVFVNEEGLIRRMPFNSRATFLWWYHVPRSRSEMLVGDAVIVGETDADGASTDIREATLDLLMREQEYAIEIVAGGAAARHMERSGMLSQVVLPLVAGGPTRLVCTARYGDYFAAMAWASTLRERWPDVEAVRVLPRREAEPTSDWRMSQL